LLRFIIILTGLGLVLPLPSASALAAQAEISSNSSPVLLAQRRRRRRRGRRSKPPVKATKEVDKKVKDKTPKTNTKVNKPPVQTKKKRRRLKKTAKKKKAAPKVAQAKGPFLPKNFGRILIYSGAGVALIGGGVAALGATLHNNAVTERQTLQAREASSDDQMQLFYNLHADMESAKLMHYAGLGLSGVALVTAAVGSFL
jgi:hypothetical protein